MIGDNIIKCEEYANFAEYKNGYLELNSPDPYGSVTVRSEQSSGVKII
jgi:hypothetical protein